MSTPPSHGLKRILEGKRAELRRFLIARTGNEADADDIINELWIKLTASHPGPVANPNSYLFRMANNLVLDRLREARRRERREAQWTAEQHEGYSAGIEVADGSPNAEESLFQHDDATRLNGAIAELPPGAQRVLKMHKLQGMSHGEVAEQLGISKSAVEKHMAVAMVHLRRVLSAEVPGARRRLLSENEGGPTVTGSGSKS